MYTVDSLDIVLKLDDVPHSSAVSSDPVVLTDGNNLLLAYNLAPRDPSHSTQWEPLAIIKFINCHDHIFGSPNDEALHRHPLYERGLKAYDAFEVQQSSWLRQVEKMTAVNAQHNKHHYFFSFKESSFECIAECYEIEFVQRSAIREIYKILKSIKKKSK